MKLFGIFLIIVALTQNLIMAILITGGIFFIFAPQAKDKKPEPLIKEKR